MQVMLGLPQGAEWFIIAVILGVPLLLLAGLVWLTVALVRRSVRRST